MRRNVTLIGMPASGKSTLGEKLAEKLGFTFVDVDRIIREKMEYNKSRPYRHGGKKL